MKSKSIFLLCQQYGEAAKITGYMISFCVFFFHAEKIRVYKVFGATVLFKTRFSLVLFPCESWFCLIVHLSIFPIPFCQSFSVTLLAAVSEQ